MKMRVNPFVFTLLLFILLLSTQTFLAQGPIRGSASPGVPIDNNTIATSTITISAAGEVQQMTVSVNITHSHAGDLSIFLRHQESGKSVQLLRSPNGPGFAFGCGADGIFATFDDRAATPMDSFDCSSDFERPVTGTYRPTQPLSGFNGDSTAGQWTLEVRDANIQDSGTLDNWSITISTDKVAPIGPPPPPGSPLIFDDRINNREVDLAAPVAIYCGENGNIKVYDVVDGNGTISLNVSGTLIRQQNNPPPSNVVLASSNGNTMSQLANGQLQVNAAGLPGEEEKEYIFIWNVDRCPPPLSPDGSLVGVSDSGLTSLGTVLNSPVPILSVDLDVNALDVPGYLIVNTDNLFVRSGDGLQFSVVAVANGGTELAAIGRNRDTSWWFIQSGAIHGWVSNDFVIVRGDLSDVPVLNATGQVLPPRFVPFDATTIYLNPTTGSNRICVLTGGLEYGVYGRTADASWYIVQAACSGVNVYGWIQESDGGLRNPASQSIPVVNALPEQPQIVAASDQGGGSTTAPVEVTPVSLSPAGPENTVFGTAIVNTSNLNLRSGAGMEYTVLATLTGGQELNVLGRVSDFDWWYVEFNGMTGWVRDEFVILRGDFVGVPVLTGLGEIQLPRFVLFSPQTLYRGPNTSSLALCELQANVEYTLIGRTADVLWYQIEANCSGNSVQGWVLAETGTVRDSAGRPIPVTN